jgi:dTDP-D-glucose 4,6-dehydratase
MKTYIVLIDVDGFNEARKLCENLENTKFNIGGSVQATAIDVLMNVIQKLGITTELSKFIEVEPISDFMDRVNDEQFNDTQYFMSYVYA